MKSRFAFGMFAGFALACLFFFFFLYFYPSAFRAQTAKNSPPYDLIAYYQVYDAHPAPADPNVPSAAYYEAVPAAEEPYAPGGAAAPAGPNVPAYEPPTVGLAQYNSPPTSPDAPSIDPYYLQAI